MLREQNNNEELLRLREEEKKQQLEANIVHKSKVKKPSALKASSKSPLMTMIKTEQKQPH